MPITPTETPTQMYLNKKVCQQTLGGVASGATNLDL